MRSILHSRSAAGRIVLVLALNGAMQEVGAADAALPRPIGADVRIRSIVYNPHEVVEVRGAYGFTAAVEFAEDEVVKTVSIGDSVAWQIVPSGNVLFLKPQEVRPETNLLVFTSRRSYAFNLLAIKPTSLTDPRLTYRVRFHYPEDEMRKLQETAAEAQRLKVERLKATAAAVVPQPKVNAPIRMTRSPAEWNFKYSYKGSKSAAPLQMFDDGEFTYMRFASYDNTPAIFLVDSDKRETLLNFRREGEWLVVERIARQYTLRANNNADIACVFNDGFPARPPSTLRDREAGESVQATAGEAKH